ncbi:MAG: cyclic nucleotide-binding domain-containing protein [Thermoanaerobaculia bacterium]|nr:cyclic nucleotide-binding domain-containing protein [Thermoanaerobaculia bacterium]
MATPVVADALAQFERNERLPAGRALFREGEEAEGVWTVRSGEVDLVFASAKGVARALRVAETGQILGLSAVISRRSHDCSATVRHNAELGFIERDRFLSLLEQQPTLWLTVLQLISSDINSCWDCLRNLTKC